ncbi:hypothetical protein PRZ48_008039 [Zasmidium cellare]|uniref:Sulfotransferase n=1 Tax=Zasmidium cellare TaxID=395010 RepID=A0ABR0EFL9_ZASCE|nr:hypothetical protein PRZ48_008039 [Zasmidium cellare]
MHPALWQARDVVFVPSGPRNGTRRDDLDPLERDVSRGWYVKAAQLIPFTGLGVLCPSAKKGANAEDSKPPKFWLNAIEAKFEGKGHPYTRADFEVGLSKYAALSDQPCCWLWRELMDAYPEAKVILIQRDFESWIKSYDTASVTDGAFTPMTEVVVWLEPLLNSYVARTVQKVNLGYFHAKNAEEILANAGGVFETHYEEIREKCAETPGRLLEMRIEEGWEPICEFLGKDVPERPFPRTNEIQALQARSSEYRRRQIRKGVASALGFVAVPVALGWAAYWYMRHQ